MEVRTYEVNPEQYDGFQAIAEEKKSPLGTSTTLLPGNLTGKTYLNGHGNALFFKQDDRHLIELSSHSSSGLEHLATELKMRELKPLSTT